jgi:hypothetical protein
MEAKFTETTEVQNFVFEVFDLALDEQSHTEMAADPATFWRSQNRIAVERIGHSRHWRA